MIDWETQLETIDDQLHAYSPLQRWFIYIASVIGIAFMGWTFYLSDALDTLDGLQEQNQALMQKIADSSPEAYRAKIDQTNEAIDREKERIRVSEADKAVLLEQMAAKEGLIFNNRYYARMLEHLLERSVRLGLKIETMESEDTDKPFFGKIVQYKKLTITGTGRYPAIADFLTFIESRETLVQIESVRIRSDETDPRFEAVILYMGVSL